VRIGLETCGPTFRLLISGSQVRFLHRPFASIVLRPFGFAQSRLYALKLLLLMHLQEFCTKVSITECPIRTAKDDYDVKIEKIFLS